MKNKLILILLILCGNYLCIGQNVTKVEYCIDVDNGVGQNTIINITPGQDIVSNLNITLPASVTPGFHKLYLRSKDSNGKWSHTTRYNINVVPANMTNNLITGEYFIDNDPQFGMGTSFTIAPQSPNITQSILPQILPTLSVGYHKIYGRIKDALGRWSHTFRINIQVTQNNQQLNVVEAEYFFGTDPEFGNATVINTVSANPSTDGTWTFNVPYPAGNYNLNDSLFMRIRDVNGKWSHTTILDAIDPNLGITNISSRKIILYPNPVVDNLLIKPIDDTTFRLTLYDAIGKMVFDKEISGEESISLSHLNSGIYFAYLWKENQKIEVVKLIKK